MKVTGKGVAMAVRTTMNKVGIWEVSDVSKKYWYRVCNIKGSRLWTIYKKGKEPVLAHPQGIGRYPKWEFIETGFKSKESAVEYVEELAAKENFNPVADHLNNIDDGVDLNAEEN